MEVRGGRDTSHYISFYAVRFVCITYLKIIKLKNNTEGNILIVKSLHTVWKFLKMSFWKLFLSHYYVILYILHNAYHNLKLSWLYFLLVYFLHYHWNISSMLSGILLILFISALFLYIYIAHRSWISKWISERMTERNQAEA